VSLDLGLKQFAPGIPERTTVLVSGASASGKTLFATRVAMAAGRAGMKVSYLDADHSFEHKVLSYFVVEMLQAGGDIRYVSLADQHPYDTTLVDIRVKEALEWADLVIVDEMPRAYARAVDQGTARGWKAAVKSINQRVANDKLPPLTAMVTYTAARVASRPGVVDSEAPIDQEKNDFLQVSEGAQVFPMVKAARDPGTHLLTVEVARLQVG
jgi:RecA/RadA recombinase